MMLAATYSFAHFAVDFGCAFAVFSRGATAEEYLIYNLFAFAMQMPLGLLADLLNKNKLFALVGILLVGLCCLFPAQGLVFVALLGLGNGLFHVGGGLDVMNLHPDRAGPLGGFVSPGALGVYLGTVLGKDGGGAFPVLLALSLSLIGLVLSCNPAERTANKPVKLPKKSAWLPALLLFFVVVLRSVGGSVSLPWKSDTLALAAVCAVVFGKALGGILADHFGLRIVGLCSLLLAALLFCFGAYPPAGLAALLLFNMTMPITLFALANVMPNTKGFAFGILTFALFVGFLPNYFGAQPLSPIAMAFVCLCSCALLALSLKAGEQE